ncbi:MAG: ABC transporter substrate-binding protein [Bdellovibrionota bacterium]
MAKILALLGIFLVAGCHDKTPLRIAVPGNFAAFIPCIADKNLGRGFSPNDVDIKWTVDTRAALKLMNDGTVDLAIAGVPNVIPELKEHKGYRIVTEIMNSTRSIVLIARTSSKIGSPPKLAGKRIGLIEGASTEIFLEYFLLTEGVNLGSIKKVFYDLPELKKQFLDGNLDAIVIWEPELSRMKSENPSLFVNEYQSFVNESLSVVVGDKSFLAHESARVDKLLKSWTEAEDWYMEHPQEAQPYIAQCLKLDPGAMESLKPALIAARFEIKLTNSLRQVYDRARDWQILRKGFKPEELPPFSEVVDMSFLARIRPRAITIGVGKKR